MRTTDNLLTATSGKKAGFDLLRASAPGRLTKFEHSQDLKLIYTSNAIEGNTLTAAETTLVIEQGITIAGRPLSDHMEAVDHLRRCDTCATWPGSPRR